MAIKTSTFGGVTLSGEDAEKFVRQVKYGRPSQRAKDAAARGRVLGEEVQKKGFVRVAPRTR